MFNVKICRETSAESPRFHAVRVQRAVGKLIFSVQLSDLKASA